MQVTDWYHCYKGSWKGMISSNSFKHPAKMAPGLLSRIITTGLDRGYWKAGDTIADPFFGIGSTAIVATYHMLKVIGVELEPAFVSLCHENFALHKRKWQTLGAHMPTVIQGDSRKFAELVASAQGVITSPPFADSLANGPSKQILEQHGANMGRSIKGDAGYGAAEGQIGADCGDSYWSAMMAVYTEVKKALKPGGVMACVVKDYVSKKQVVPLVDQTAELLCRLRFDVFEQDRAWLVTEDRRPGLFGEDSVKTKSRKSFFRRIHEKKGGPQINYEVVLWARAGRPPAAPLRADFSNIKPPARVEPLHGQMDLFGE